MLIDRHIFMFSRKIRIWIENEEKGVEKVIVIFFYFKKLEEFGMIN